MSYRIDFKPRKGFNSVIKHLSKLDGVCAEWGVYASSGMHPEAGMLYSALMAIHELRTDGYRRPILNISATNSRFVGGYKKILASAVEEYVYRAATGRYSDAKKVVLGVAKKGSENAISIFGNNRRLMKNAPATIKAKGHNKPMIELGSLKRQIKFKTLKRGEE